MIQDLRFALRVLVKSPGFTIVAVLTLALGIGANTAIFSVINGMVLKPLPYPESDRLMSLSEWSQQVPGMSVSLPNYLDWRSQNKVFEHIAAIQGTSYNLTGRDQAERLQGARVTANFFDCAGLKPALGRTFREDEDRVGGERVVVLSFGLWQRLYGGDRGILGRTVSLNGDVHTIVGVMPQEFRLPSPVTEIWTPIMHIAGQPNIQDRGNHPGIYVMARRKPGVTVEQARADMTAIAKRLSEEYVQNRGAGVTVTPLLERMVGPDMRTAMWVLMTAVGCVLLIACANVANLLLARASGRQKEVAIRAAMGAGRLRLIRQLLTECVVLALAGAVLGVALAIAGVRALVAAVPPNAPRIAEVTVDGQTLLFTLFLAVVTGIIFGLAPTFQLARHSLSETLKEGGRTGASVGHHRMRSLLVMSEVALALVLLIGAGLAMRSFLHLQNTSPGFSPENVLSAGVSLPDAKYREPHQRRAFTKQVVDRILATPGVVAAGAIMPLPTGGSGWQTSFVVEGMPEPEPGKAPSTDIARVTPDYFRTMGVRLLQGRVFSDADNENSPRVAIVDETFAKTYWPNQDPIGKRIRTGGISNPWISVVGVVNHVKNYGVASDSRVETYLPYAQSPVGALALVVRTASEPTSIISAVREQVRSVDSEMPVYNVKTMEKVLADGISPRRITMMLLGVFAVVALVLASVGIYGVVSYTVAQRTHEIGVRMALGAGRGDVLCMVVRQGMTTVLIGLGIGLTAAFGLTRLMTTLLFGVSAKDPGTFSGTALVLALVALVASYVPARRATRVNPVVALRYE